MVPAPTDIPHDAGHGWTLERVPTDGSASSTTHPSATKVSKVASASMSAASIFTSPKPYDQRRKNNPITLPMHHTIKTYHVKFHQPKCHPSCKLLTCNHLACNLLVCNHLTCLTPYSPMQSINTSNPTILPYSHHPMNYLNITKKTAAEFPLPHKTNHPSVNALLIPNTNDHPPHKTKHHNLPSANTYNRQPHKHNHHNIRRNKTRITNTNNPQPPKKIIF